MSKQAAATGREGEEEEAAGKKKGARKGRKQVVIDEDQMKQELQGVDILKLGKAEVKKLEEEGDHHDHHADHDEHQQPSGGLIVSMLSFFLRREPEAALPWQISRREEIESLIASKSSWLIKAFGQKYWYSKNTNTKIQYWGETTIDGQRVNRGICAWPDPPLGGGESYYGLWMHDLPDNYGVFCWFDGDCYLGQWHHGKMEGYGVYVYGKKSPYASHRYEGSYHAGRRQGTGIYMYNSKEKGVYIGEWLRGQMNGLGILLYVDDEYYIGGWFKDQKHGLGVYQWGQSHGAAAGDKYEGYFKLGKAHGNGKTTYQDGGGICLGDGAREVQIYNMGEYKGSREYDLSKDWSELEAAGEISAREGGNAARMARENIGRVTEIGRRAKISQRLAQHHAREAKFFAKASIRYRKFREAWMGLKKYIVIDED
ncbi:hypothetical protein GUITHDRAFT_120674 [Guillardia theta CCMP2712]|uniref:Uncharacterized protein n=1 Tax=Guillardia theta (strain CCMP2712) TaxID=905079 RepID=L1IBD9_GUITC|nr:hypothetical protein GUITHDRAFT_120674 [Guillardia theta CCMP2712]EKX33155.1 hypothetical protein GUITHDRAFT_120674 [Guillardia theta CCMP2712]|eukprot:XP_005820135.1 hypothetical protein GUITHDRAFT_120674 [Guillardia theta CCMP2712]